MAGYSNTPLYKKLGIKKDMKVVVLYAPNYYIDLFGKDIEYLPDFEYVLFGKVDFIHSFFTNISSLKADFKRLKNGLSKAGVLWISWPKKNSKIKTDLDENKIREIGLKNGLVDVKVAAIDDTYSGLKFVYRLKDR